jgi:hypothetical protein
VSMVAAFKKVGVRCRYKSDMHHSGKTTFGVSVNSGKNHPTIAMRSEAIFIDL